MAKAINTFGGAVGAGKIAAKLSYHLLQIF
jgi:hypothetical protein